MRTVRTVRCVGAVRGMGRVGSVRAVGRVGRMRGVGRMRAVGRVGRVGSVGGVRTVFPLPTAVVGRCAVSQHDAQNSKAYTQLNRVLLGNLAFFAGQKRFDVFFYGGKTLHGRYPIFGLTQLLKTSAISLFCNFLNR